MSENNFETGETYYTQRGEKVCLDALTTDGKFVVSHLMRYMSYDGEVYEDFGPSSVVDKLFQEAPVAVLDERFAEAERKLAEIEETHRKRFSEINNHERETQDRLKKLAKFKGLERLEDFIDGTFGFFVVDTYDGFTIMPRDKALEHNDRYDKKLKLLSLFGDTNGSLEWCLNEYRDGSGSYKTVFPCFSIEEGLEIINRECTATIENWRAKAANSYVLGRAVTSLERNKLPIPQDALEARNRDVAAMLEKNVADARAALAKSEDALSKFVGVREPADLMREASDHG